MAFADGRVDRKGLQDALDATLSGTFELFGRAHEVLLGANFLETSTDIRISPYTGRTDQPWEEEPVDIFNFDPYAYPAPQALFAPYVGVRVKTRQSGYYTALKFSATDELTLSAGARVSNYTTTNRSLLTGATTIDNDADSEVTPYAAVVYGLTDTYSLYASYTDIFQVQNNYNDRGDLLPPIVGANYEAGVKAEWWDGLLNGSLALFRIEQTNRAQSDPRYPGTCLGSPTGACSIAEGEVRSEGAEIELSGQLLTDLELVAGYTYNTTEYIRDRTASGDPSANQGQPFNTITPEHLFRLWGNYKLPLAGKQFSVGTGLSAQSSMYFQNGGVRVGQGGYALWNARVGYTPNDRLTFSLNGNNLLDKVYYAGINFPGANYYGEPRNFMLTVRTTF
jgi:outer membrane receptor for ferric coprogen and ferric-rhodotorulic acid